MISKPITWLLAGTALTLCAGAAFATTEQQARQEAEQDAARAERPERVEKTERREVRVYRADRNNETDRRVIVDGGREQSLSDILQLRPDQATALGTFLAATRPQRDEGREHMVRFDRDADGRSTLQKLDEMQAKAAQQQAEMNRKIAAIKTFYGQLDEKQRKAFDAMPMLMMVGPSIGPMMIPRPMPISHRFHDSDTFRFPAERFDPPMPPVPPTPPSPPRS